MDTSFLEDLDCERSAADIQDQVMPATKVEDSVGRDAISAQLSAVRSFGAILRLKNLSATLNSGL